MTDAMIDYIFEVDSDKFLQLTALALTPTPLQHSEAKLALIHDDDVLQIIEVRNTTRVVGVCY